MIPFIIDEVRRKNKRTYRRRRLSVKEYTINGRAEQSRAERENKIDSA